MPIVAALLPILNRWLERLFPDPIQREKALQDLLKLLMAADLSQMEVNKAEAGTGNMFMGGWRPAIGWVCASALFYTYLLVPLGMWAAQIAGVTIPKPPVLDGNLWELMFGLLGMSALRTFEKFKGVSR